MKRQILTASFLSAIAPAVVMVGIAGLGLSPSSVAQSSAATGAPPHADKATRGKYLVTIAGCNDCHTPLKDGPDGPEPDMSRMLSGHPETIAIASAPSAPQSPWAVTITASNTAWSGFWGVSYSANLTPDADTGLGRWTLRNFKDTIRTGRHLGRGRPVLPPMPIPMYKHMTDEDLEAVFAYLQTIPPVRNRVPQPLSPSASTAETPR
jgi:mono/diheme cytochrome c family protein